jgi:hypothetical protein
LKQPNFLRVALQQREHRRQDARKKEEEGGHLQLDDFLHQNGALLRERRVCFMRFAPQLLAHIIRRFKVGV